MVLRSVRIGLLLIELFMGQLYISRIASRLMSELIYLTVTGHRLLLILYFMNSVTKIESISVIIHSGNNLVMVANRSRCFLILRNSV